jgi:putative Mn2+ efflux pump MntP
MDAQFFTSIMSGIITILGAVFLYVFVPWVKQRMKAEQLMQLMLLVEIAVTAVKQIFKGMPEVTDAEKKDYCLEYLKTLGVDVSMDQLDALIEAMVYQINLANKDKVPEAKPIL